MNWNETNVFQFADSTEKRELEVSAREALRQSSPTTSDYESDSVFPSPNRSTYLSTPNYSTSLYVSTRNETHQSSKNGSNWGNDTSQDTTGSQLTIVKAKDATKHEHGNVLTTDFPYTAILDATDSYDQDSQSQETSLPADRSKSDTGVIGEDALGVQNGVMNDNTNMNEDLFAGTDREKVRTYFEFLVKRQKNSDSRF